MSNCATPFIDDFQWAVIRLATLQEKRGEPGRLLFATVTLLSPGRPPPSNMAGSDSKKLGKSGMTVFFRRTVLNAQAAIDWYRLLGKGGSKTPIPSLQENICEKDGLDITVSNLVDDPLWPKLGLPMGEGLLAQPFGRSNPAPFIGSIPARVHRRFGNTEGFGLLLANDEALAFIARRLHIFMRDYPEYLGSVALVVPDPIIKQIDNFLIPASNGQGERIFYRFVPRPEQTLDGLKIAMFDEQAYLLSNFETRDVPANGILEVDKGSCIGAYGYVVTHPVQGVLAYHPPAGFMRQIGLNIDVVSQIRKVSVPIGDSPKSPQTEYRVHRTQNAQSSVIGDEPTIPNVNMRVGIAARQREKAANALRYDQHWFGDGQRENAMAFIRARVGRARNRIMVADPYFGVLQAPQYLLAITSDSVKIKILTSRLAFESGYAPEVRQEETFSLTSCSFIQKLLLFLQQRCSKFKCNVVADTLTPRFQQFDEEIKRVKTEGNTDVEVMVLPGKSPALHDRFLVVDEEVWFLGNSLNTLGVRASMIIKLPNPDEVIRKLEEMLKQAVSFNTYHQRRITASKSVIK
ncbi:VPA1262 family N-terminal domain-containing protein [Acidithiobacillus sp.]|uniref:VPA1262 family N-terminal domain-containing protein n=1 Tax=Acidithiobacillus sp. TaxID=1872118 RepID=UPI003CFD0753